MEFLTGLKERLLGIPKAWGNLNLNQKVLTAGAVLLILATIFVSVSALLRTDYEPLFTNLGVNDAAAMTAKLQELNIPYELDDGGTTILVPSEAKYSTRLELAAVGLPQGAAGFEIFNETSFGETETDKRIKYQVALQGELTNTIQSMDKIEFAKVNLVIPEDSLYAENQEIATASVLIKNEANASLSSKEIQGIVHLVANSVEGLALENVTVVDTKGNVLSTGISEVGNGSGYIELTQAQMVLQRQYERELQTSVQSMLERLVGENKVVVRASAVLDFDERESRMEIYAPIQDKETPVTFPRSEHETEESSTETGQAAGGVPGTETNIPTYQETTEGSTTASSQRSERTTNWEIDKEEVLQRFAPGTLKRITVAVLIDKELSQPQKDEIEQLVETAVGINRNNANSLDYNVTVTSMMFSEPEEPVAAASIMDLLVKYAWLIAVIFLCLLVLAFVLFKVLVGRKEKDSGFDVIVDDEINLEDISEIEISDEEKESRRMREEVEKLIDSNPEEMANLMRTWL
ncbi:MAG: flagellar M-ring protein FliF, partial [Syntrophomonadaceae bacterium]|nr:flagellar M-ring protein FliF [Syntrophomonadaceae bacterium]